MSAEELNAEKWKSVVDYTKTIIGLATSVLTVILGLVVIGELHPTGIVAIGIVLILASVLFSLFSFGRATICINEPTDDKKRKAVLYANLGTFLLVACIALLAFTSGNPSLTLDDALKSVETSTRSMKTPLKASQCVSMNKVGDTYELAYTDGQKKSTAVVGIESGQIITISESN